MDRKRFIKKYIKLKAKRYGFLIIVITLTLSIFFVYNNIRDVYKPISFLSSPKEKSDFIFLELLDTFFNDFWEFLVLILIPFIGVIVFIQNIEKGIINHYLIQPISRRFLLTIEYLTMLLFLFIAIVLSFTIGLATTIIFLREQFYMDTIDIFSFLVSSIVLFILVINLYSLIISLGIITRESLSSISTYYLIIFSIKIIIPNLFFEGRLPAMITLVQFFLNLLTPIGVKKYIEDVIFLLSLYLSIGLVSLAISYLIINKIDL